MHRHFKPFAFALCFLSATAAHAQQPPAPPPAPPTTSPGAAPVAPAPPGTPPGMMPPGMMPGGAMPPGAMPPGAGMPPPYYQPQAPLMVAPRVLDWEEGETIPAGYHKGTTIRTGLVVAGAVTFGTTWLGSSIAGSFGVPILCAPVVGPFVIAGQVARDSGVAAFWLIFDGLVQAGGLAMLIGGLAAPRTVLLRDDVRSAKTWFVPTPMSFGNRGYGLGFVGTW